MGVPFNKPITYLITKGEVTDANFELAARELHAVIAAAVEEGVSLIQIREKQLSTRLLCVLAERAAEITRGFTTKLLINDRADVALAAGADGVHITENSLPANVIRGKFPDGFLIGVSAHSIDSVRQAVADNADLVVFAPVFATPGKGEPKGLDALREACNAVAPFPVLALGGVDECNMNDVLAAGASGFAAIRAMNDVGSLRTIMRRLT